MLRKPLRCDEKAISPVIATIIIVAVAIVMSIAVAYWMMGLATTFTRYEKLDFIAAYPIKGDITGTNGQYYNITLSLKNTGTSPASVTKFFFNGVPDSIVNQTNQNKGGLNITYSGGNVFKADGTAVVVNPGDTVTFVIQLPYNATIGGGRAVSGVMLEIVVQTATGNQYPKVVVLP
ncbi:MAG: archaellin/type IV pilin N-terminal domain-containing protein [Candidatus Nezhaarchaeales archaeon]